MYSIEIFLDDTRITDHISQWGINISENNYINTFRLVFQSREFFSQCNWVINWGEKRIKIIIDDIVYEFLLEKRVLSESPEDESFSIWGRSYLCTLDMPYVTLITDKEVIQDPDTGEWICEDDPSYVAHIWQTRDVLFNEILSELISSDYVIVMEIDDFIVKTGVLSASKETPLEIIDRLIKEVGAHIRTDLEDKLILRYWEFDSEGEGSPVATFLDMDGIILLEESYDLPEGYNQILVTGYEDPSSEQSINFQLVLDDERNEGKNEFLFATDIWIRLYRSPFDVEFKIETTLGILTFDSTILESISDEVSGFSDETLTADRPINAIISIQKYDCEIVPVNDYEFEQGYTIITALSDNLKDEPVLFSYVSQYNLYKLNVTQPCDPLPADEIISRIIVTSLEVD